MNEFERFIPITKVDDEERMVYGYASTPTLDSDNEIITLDAIKEALPAYLQFPTLREMHQPIAAGTVKSTEIREDKNKGLYIGAKVVDEGAWLKVKEGVYRGFSVGGHVKQKVGNIISGIDLVEISLVDVPANKKAKIEVWKSGKLSKDAETVYSLSSIMIQLKDAIAWAEMCGKDTKSLVKALENIKSVIAVEATETEKDHQDAMEAMWGDMSMSDKADDIKKVIASLDRINFDDPVAEVLRKVVKFNMENKLEKKQETTPVVPETGKEGETPVVPVTPEVPAKEEDTPVVVEPVTPAEGAEVSEETVPPVTPVAPTKESEKSENADTLAKLNDVAQSLNTLNETLAKSGKDNEELSKTVAGFSENLTKISDVVKELASRVEVIEKTAIPLKSKASYVVERDSAEKADTVDPESPKGKLLARKAKLTEMFDKIGANDFAKGGFSLEAAQIENELEKIK